MNIPHVLAQIIRRSPSLSSILEATVEIIARELGTDVCSIYLLDPTDHRLRLTATQGLNKESLGKVSLALGEGITGIVVSEMRSIAVEDASQHPSYRYFPETGEERFRSYLGVPMAIRNRPVGAIVVQSEGDRKFNKEETETLNTIAAQLVGVVENARLINALDRPEQGYHYLEEVRLWHHGLVTRQRTDDAQKELVYSGNPASEGIAIGKVIFRGSYDLGSTCRVDTVSDPAGEKKKLAVAMERTGSDIMHIQEAVEKETDEEHALIFTSHLFLLNDPTLIERMHTAIDNGHTAPKAVDMVFGEIEVKIGTITDAYLQERVEDIRDLRNRILSNLLEHVGPISNIAKNIVVSQGLHPSLVVELKIQGALGIITERGGMTSHGALLARAMGIPAVTGVEGVLDQLHSGEEAVVDGTSGTVVLRPTSRTLVQFRKTVEKNTAIRNRLDKIRDEPAVSPDGVKVTLLANVGIASEIHQAILYGAEGIGLYRTEFPFMLREDFPTREEQVSIYRRACNAFPEGPIYFRLLDLGGDKHHPRITRTDESNPVLGHRSIRLMLDHPSILKEQVQAFALVSEGRQTEVLIPMISSLQELRKTRELIVKAIEELDSPKVKHVPRIGIMVEVPAAVEIALDLAREADFISIGTNDLIQFTLAADRENSRVAVFGDSFHPAILRMIRRTIVAGHEAGIPVGCCGEMSSTPEMALLLVAMGIDSLSLIPSSIPRVKEIIRKSRIDTIRDQLESILALPESALIRERIRSLIPQEE